MYSGDSGVVALSKPHSFSEPSCESSYQSAEGAAAALDVLPYPESDLVSFPRSHACWARSNWKGGGPR